MSSLWLRLYRLRGWVQIYLFVGFSWTHLLAFTVFAAELLNLVYSPFPGFMDVAVMITLLGLASFVIDNVKMALSTHEDYLSMLDPRELATLKLSETHRTYRLEPVYDAYVLYSEEVNRLLRTTALPLCRSKSKFRLTEQAKSVAPLILHHRFSQQSALFNSHKVRLQTDLTVDIIREKCRVWVQPTDYYSGVCTNEATGLEVRSKKTKKRIFDGYSLMSDSGIILDLAESHCSNHIAASTLAFTADRKLVVQRQASTAFIDSDRLVSSGSGSTDLRDLNGSITTLQQLVIATMKRELSEELGLPAGTLVKSIITGYARFVSRGAKPEFFGVSYVAIDSKDLRIRPSETVFIADLDPHRVNREDLEELKAFLRSFRTNPGSLLSLDLYLNLLFLENLIQSAPDDFLCLFEQRSRGSTNDIR